MNRETGRLLVVGLDGATFDVLSPLMEAGILPNLAALRERGCWGKLLSTIPPFTAAAWSTFITGKNPGRHGVISFRSRDRFHYDVEGSGFVNAQRFGETLWEILSDHGKRIGLINVPLTYPARPVNGYMVTGMLTPPGARRFTYPPELVHRLGPDYMIDVEFIRRKGEFRQRGFPPKTEMLTQIRRMSRTRARKSADLFSDEPWDFFMVVFTSTDRVLHFFWDDLTALIAEGARGVTAPRNAIQEDILAYFRELDDGIGHLVDLAGPTTTTFVISDHGFGPAPRRRFYLNVWLEQLGLLRRRGAQGWTDLEYWRVAVGRHKRIKSALRRVLPPSVQDSAKTVSEKVSGEIIDWSLTRAYFVPIYFHVCGVEINLAGAKREGIVRAGAEYEALRNEIIHEASELSDPENGKPIVEVAARREELYDGPYVEEFPDVILVLDPDYIGASSLAGTSLVEPHPHPMRPGEHRQDGIFVAAGPPVLSRGELSGLHLQDVPPTILFILGLPSLSSFDGRVLQEIFKHEYLETHPISVEESPEETRPRKRSQTEGYSGPEEQSIMDRLRGLGYLD